jgi:hypothetical protein
MDGWFFEMCDWSLSWRCLWKGGLRKIVYDWMYWHDVCAIWLVKGRWSCNWHEWELRVALSPELLETSVYGMEMNQWICPTPSVLVFMTEQFVSIYVSFERATQLNCPLELSNQSINFCFWLSINHHSSLSSFRSKMQRLNSCRKVQLLSSHSMMSVLLAAREESEVCAPKFALLLVFTYIY